MDQVLGVEVDALVCLLLKYYSVLLKYPSCRVVLLSLLVSFSEGLQLLQAVKLEDA